VLPLRYTLLCDGPTDRALIPIINWVIGENLLPANRSFVDQLADLRVLPHPPRKLAERVAQAVEQLPGDLLFVHRDAERQPLDTRVAEIEEAAQAAACSSYVPVVPVRMTEAWLLIDVGAVRLAADNPNGEAALDLPAHTDLETISDPKALLHNSLLLASEKSGRRRQQFKSALSTRSVRVSEYIDDFSPLRSLLAFRRFEEATKQALTSPS
jgi:hypothetical protein